MQLKANAEVLLGAILSEVCVVCIRESCLCW